MKKISAHKKISCYLFENQHKLGVKIIGKELICYFERVNNGRGIKAFKLDLLGIYDESFCMIEVKSGQLTMAHVMKYEKAWYNFTYLDRGVCILFVVKSVQKKVEKFIEGKLRYRIIYLSELDGLDNYEPKEFEVEPNTEELEEYKISFLIGVFFPNLKRYIWNSNIKFLKSQFGDEYSELEFILKNNYRLFLDIKKNNKIIFEFRYYNHDKKIIKNYDWVFITYFNNVIYQIVYVQKLIRRINRLPNKKINDDEFNAICDIATEYTYKTLKKRYDEYKNTYMKIVETIPKKGKNNLFYG